jgi:hypothetical protein
MDVTIGLVGPKMPGGNEYIGTTLTLRTTGGEIPSQQGGRGQSRFRSSVSAWDKVLLPTQSMRLSGSAAALEAAFTPASSMMLSPTQGE